MKNRIVFLFGVYFMDNRPYDFTGMMSGRDGRSTEEGWGEGYIEDMINDSRSAIHVQTFDEENGLLYFTKQYPKEPPTSVIAYNLRFHAARNAYLGPWRRPYLRDEMSSAFGGVAIVMTIPADIPDDFAVLPEGFGQ